MKQPVLIGQTDYTVLVKIRDDAGAPATGLTEASIDIAYARVETDNDVTTTDVTPAALTALTDAHTDWGFEEVSATDHPGLYRLDIADAVFASGAWSAVVTIVGTGLDPADLEFVLVNFDPKATALPANSITATVIATGAIDADAIADGAIDAGAIAPDAITAAKVAADVTTEIQSGLATAAELAKVPKSDGTASWNATAAAQIQSEANDALVAYDPPTRTEATADKDEIIVETDAINAKTTNLPSDPADASVVAGLIAAVETKVDGVKAKTDSLTFTVAGQVDANTQSINDVTITGDGQVGTEFGVS